MTFTYTGSADPDGTLTSWKWDLDGDGTFETTTPTGAATTTYATPRTVTVRMYAVDDSGEASATAEQAVTIAAAGWRPDAGSGNSASRDTTAPRATLVKLTRPEAQLPRLREGERHGDAARARQDDREGQRQGQVGRDRPAPQAHLRRARRCSRPGTSSRPPSRSRCATRAATAAPLKKTRDRPARRRPPCRPRLPQRGESVPQAAAASLRHAHARSLPCSECSPASSGSWTRSPTCATSCVARRGRTAGRGSSGACSRSSCACPSAPTAPRGASSWPAPRPCSRASSSCSRSAGGRVA